MPRLAESDCRGGLCSFVGSDDGPLEDTVLHVDDAEPSDSSRENLYGSKFALQSLKKWGLATAGSQRTVL
jgi:hypothetical protein